MTSRIKISKPDRLPRDGITDTDLNTWKNELLNYLGQDDNFDLFTDTGSYPEWQAAENDRNRILVAVIPDSAADLPKRRKQISNFLTIIAGCCYKDHYMLIIEQATSLEWIWKELKNLYQITHVGKDFLNIVDIKYDPETMSASSVYNQYRAKILENLKPKNTIIKWKNNTSISSNESLTPTFEDHILLSVIQLIDSRLPAKVREIYGPRMDNEKFLMDFKQDILCNVPKMIDDLESQDNQINAMKIKSQHTNLAPVRFNDRRQQRSYQKKPGMQSGKFCRLCHLAQKPRQIVTSHEIGELACPSLSQRDKNALQQRSGMLAGIATSVEDDLDTLAKLHGYGENEDISEDDAANHHQVNKITCVNFISPVPSQILTLYQNDKIVHVDIDSGCWVSCVRLDFAKEMDWNIKSNSQLAKLADDKTVLKSVGEIDQVLTRNNWKVHLRALVLPELHTKVIGGNNFLRDNCIEQSIHNKRISVHGKYIVPETNRNVELPSKLNPIIIKTEVPKILLPDQSITVKVPIEDNETVLVEPRIENSNKLWPQPQLCTVINGEIKVANKDTLPTILKTKQHHIQIRPTEEASLSKKPTQQFQFETIKNPNQGEEKLNINYDCLDEKQIIKLNEAIEECKDIFDKNLSKGYNQFSGKHYCHLNWANNQRPLSKKVICPNYNRQLNNLLQEVCDNLTNQGVLGVPQNDQVIVQYVSPCFLRKKQKAKDKPNSELTKDDVRLVVNTIGLSQHLKNIPTKVTRPQEVYSSLSRWNYIIKTDLFQGFFQNHLHPSAYQWCAIQTPFGGMRYFKRSIQGLVGQTEEQDELLARILHKELMDGICVKIADDIFAGGVTIDEAIDNWIRIMKILSNNNLKIALNKTVLFPKQVDVLSWVWKEGGYLSPSPHRKLALQKVNFEDIKTVKDMRSYVGLYKTFIDCTPNLTIHLDKFDQLVGSKQSNDDITWTPDLIQVFTKSKELISQMKDLYLPRPDDQLIITCDGARTPPAVGMILQARTQDNKIKIVKYFSVKLKPHMIKWNPCEIEACALGTAIECFYDYIKQSTKSVVICPDSKAVVDAANKLAKGMFSLSPKIQTFLNNLSKIKYDIQHISGKSGHNAASDYQSRNSYLCKSEVCQICTYVQDTSDTIIDVKLNAAIHTADKTAMPFLNREVWKDLQEKDHACRQAKICLSSGQQPTKKAGNTNNNIRKYVSKADVAKDGLLVVLTTVPMTSTKQEKIIIPSNFVDAIITQLHVKFQHPTKSQLLHLFNRYFYATGANRIIEETYNNCQICQSNKRLPAALVTYSTTTVAEHPGTHFGVDIMRQAKQKILIARDQFSSYVTATFINDETKDTLRDALIAVINPIRTTGPVTVRTDNAASFKSLHNGDTALEKMEIHIELSDPMNKNGNACVDKAIGEVIDEITRILPSEQNLSQTLLAQAILHLNSRIRRKGKLSAAEILFSRDQLNNHNLLIEDKEIQSDQTNTRQLANQRNNEKVKQADINIHQGDIVQMRDNPKKHQVRDSFLVVEVAEKDKTIHAKKILHSYTDKKTVLRKKEYKFPSERVERLNRSTFSTIGYEKLKTIKPITKINNNQWTPFRNDISSDSPLSSEDDTINEGDENGHDLEVNHENMAVHENMDVDENMDVHQNIDVHENMNVHEPRTEQISVMDVDETLNNMAEEGINQDQANIEVETNANDGDDEMEHLADISSTADESTGARRKIRKETWSTKDTYRLRYTPYRKAKAKQNSEILRDNDREAEKEAIPSTDTTRTRVLSSGEDSIKEPSIEWDNYEPSPTYFEETDLAMVDEYPKSVEVGRVYDFSNLPPLELYPETVEYGKVYDFSHLPHYPIVTNMETNAEKVKATLGKPSKKPTLLEKFKKIFLH